MSCQRHKKPAARLASVQLIAPCGINCAVCIAYLRERNPCPGCRAHDPTKPKTRRLCLLRNCRERRGAFCGGSASFPCHRLVRLDRRYRLKYGVSPIANLHRLASVGLGEFLAEEKIKWACPACGVTLCMHKPACP